jgi:hypothetical protein
MKVPCGQRQGVFSAKVVYHLRTTNEHKGCTMRMHSDIDIDGRLYQ